MSCITGFGSIHELYYRPTLRLTALRIIYNNYAIDYVNSRCVFYTWQLRITLFINNPMINYSIAKGKLYLLKTFVY